MAVCNKIIRKSTRPAIGSLNRRVIIHTRFIVPPSGDNTEYTESLVNDITVWALVQPTRGDKIFDGSNIIRVDATDIYIRYIPNITFEKRLELINWGSVDNDYFQILTVTNLDEANRFIKFECSRRGTINKPINT
jgi:head-tail adaptor